VTKGTAARPDARRQPALRWLRRMAWLVLPVALLGELGHQVLQRAGQTLAHHFFHILFGAGAVIAFTAYAIVDIRRHGWPGFQWRVRPVPRSPAPRGANPP
jgi:hypothetical protein